MFWIAVFIIRKFLCSLNTASESDIMVIENEKATDKTICSMHRIKEYIQCTL